MSDGGIVLNLFQINTITSYLDGSVVYGSNIQTADKLRAYFKGYLSTSNGQLPTNYMNLNMANPTEIEASTDLRWDISNLSVRSLNLEAY